MGCFHSISSVSKTMRLLAVSLCFRENSISIVHIKLRKQLIVNNVLYFLPWKLNSVDKLLASTFYFWWFVSSVSNKTFHPKAPNYFWSASHHDIDCVKRKKVQGWSDTLPSFNTFRNYDKELCYLEVFLKVLLIWSC